MSSKFLPIRQVWIWFAFLLILMMFPALAYSGNKNMYDRAVLSAGDTSLIKKVMLKAEKGKKTVFGLIGGSITKGSKASTLGKTYGYQVVHWWEENFPKSEIFYINKGVASTGSDIGVFRINKDLLRYKPDIVVVEFSVNDSNTESSAETLEGLIRQSLSMPDPPAILLLMMCSVENQNKLLSAQEWHSKVGYHYNLPMISLKDALSPEFQPGKLKVENFFADDLHPNDFGHKLVADLVCTFFERIKNELTIPHKQLSQNLPRPLISKRYDCTDFLQPGDINPISNKGWQIGKVERFSSAWESGISGSEIVFEVEGAEINLLYDCDQNACIVDAFVDNLPPKRICSFSSSSSSPGVTNILSSQKSGKHKVVIKSIDGNSFKLIAFMTALE